MSISRASLVSAALLAVTGAVALGLADDSAGTVLFALLAIGIPGLLARPDRPLLSRGLARALVIGGFCLFPVDGLWLSGDWMMALARLLLVVQAVKVSAPVTVRDVVLVQGTSLAHLAVAAVITMDVTFATCFAAYAVLAIWSMLLLHLRREVERTGTGERRTAGLLDRSFVGFVTVLAGVALAFSGLVFLVIPRVGAGFLRPGGLEGRRIAGFSSQVDLDDIGSIQEDPTVALRVRFATDPGPAPYLRGGAYAHYGNGRWSRLEHERRDVPRAPRIPGEPRVFLPPADRPSEPEVRSDEVRATIRVPPAHGRVLFTYGRPDRLVFPDWSPDHLHADASGSIRMRRSVPRDIRYRVEGRIPRPSPDQARRASDPDSVHRIYLSFPDDLDVERVEALARRIVEEAGATDDRARVEALASHLRETFEYTFTMPDRPPGDPIEAFLFETRTGHCEYFASGLVLLCRALEIPARLVNGFAIGEANAVGDYHVFRRSDAHAWAEVCFADAGWLPVDPTPEATLDRPVPLFDWVSDTVDWLKMQWLERVITFGQTEQREMAQGIRSQVRDVERDVRDLLAGRLPGPRLPSWPVALLLGAGLLGLVLRWTTGRAGGRTLRAPAWYRSFEKIANRAGCPREEGETPLELAGRLTAALGAPAGPPARRVVETLYEDRFAGRPPDETTRSEVEEALETLEALRRDEPADAG